ncbi:unnamed protein product [Brassicogethes aeneus]|uniref:UDP-glucuronosyltransferase n=1 Tax=Brassicogethes aeneus TaxID=1431903 RepID=A0A9P0FLS1_BRAAE|nr:unnamed protein product [Brassicogethes aeneus]
MLVLESKCANILFFASAPSYSHQSMYQPVWKELSLRGHKVVAITPNPLRDSTLTNLTEIDMSSMYETIKKLVPKQGLQKLLEKPSFFMVFRKDPIMTYLFSKYSELFFQHENMQKFLKEDRQFDVVVEEWIYPTFAALGAKYNAPLIGISSLGAPIPALDTVGNPSHPVYAPDHNLPVGRDMTFRERLMSGLWAVYVRVLYHLVVLPREDALARKYLGDDLPYLGDIERNVSLILLNRNPVFHRVMPMVPTVIELGYMNRSQTKKEMDPELKSFMDNSKRGVIYFSLGSSIPPSSMAKPILNAIINTFVNIPYDVVFKWDAAEFERPKHILLRKWVPQSTLLAHPNLKLFITQGGLQSSDEAIINHVPIIGIPFQSDQHSNVDTLEKYGMGKMLDYEDITEERLTKLIHEITSNKSYKENAVKLFKLYIDHPKGAVEKAVWWIEYVIRNKGATHLRSASMDIPWYQYLMLDVIGFLIMVFAAIILINIVLIKLIIKFALIVFRRYKNIKNKKNN